MGIEKPFGAAYKIENPTPPSVDSYMLDRELEVVRAKEKELNRKIDIFIAGLTMEERLILTRKLNGE